MPRIIVKCRYIKSEAAHRSNLIGYIVMIREIIRIILLSQTI